jgi:hypothetical protein
MARESTGLSRKNQRQLIQKAFVLIITLWLKSLHTLLSEMKDITQACRLQRKSVQCRVVTATECTKKLEENLSG